MPDILIQWAKWKLQAPVILSDNYVSLPAQIHEICYLSFIILFQVNCFFNYISIFSCTDNLPLLDFWVYTWLSIFSRTEIVKLGKKTRLKWACFVEKLCKMLSWIYSFIFKWRPFFMNRNMNNLARFVVLTVVLLKIQVFWDVIWYDCASSWHYRGSHCLHLQSEGTANLWNVEKYLPNNQSYIREAFNPHESSHL
jgi:hypothetical protein